MRWKSFLRIIIELLAITALTFIWSGSVWSQSTYKTLHKFNGKDGQSPIGSLIFDAAENLYGTTQIGGKYSNCYFGTCGTVFELTPNVGGTWNEHVLHNFNGTDGTAPLGELIFDSAGNLYGTANRGGDDGYGTVFELTPQAGGAWTESVLYTFKGQDGMWPSGGLIFDASGNLYGTTTWGCGMGCVFELTPNSNGYWTETILYGFGCCGGPTGGYPNGTTLIFDAAGNIYGTTEYGGKSGCNPGGCYGLGVVYELSPKGDGTWTQKVLHKFTGGKDGSSPTDALVFDAAGNLYGTTNFGGKYNQNGNVFQLTPNADGTWTEHVLHQFTGGKDGGAPFAGVTFDKAGNLYGTARKGGTAGYGVVYKMTPNSNGGWSYRVLHAFLDQPGANPWSGIILDSAGNLYGTTGGDGTKTFGSVFEITP
jgi:uncharacterized repeat protein (TIGR03803 family)